MKKIFSNFLIIFLILMFILLNTSLWFPIRSYVFMFFYSKFHEKESLLNKYSIHLNIPGGLSTRNKDWYPFVMTFNDDKGFSRYLDRDICLTILYNFGHFIFKHGASSYYNLDSKYFSSFYGGYIVKNNTTFEPPFGFNNDGSINIDEISSIPNYDQKELVLRGLGCPRNKMIFNISIDYTEYDINYVNYQGWTKVDSTIITNSPIHRFKENLMAYVQYGKPIARYYYNEDFPIITLRGRIYAKYFKAYDLSIFLYILSPNIKTLNECDKNILSKTVITKDN